MLAAEHIDTDRHHLGYAPHITLAIYPEGVPVGMLAATVMAIAERWRALPVMLSGIGIFPGNTSILWAAPVVTRELLCLHASVAEALPDLPVHPHYRAEAWMPHVTLTGAIPNPAVALNALLRDWQPMAAMAVQADLVHFRPVEVLSSQALSG